jgi:hypothetical protein
MRKIAMVLGALMFLLNPNLACDAGDQFQYSEADMRAAVEGTWLVNFTASDGTATQVTLRIDEGSGSPTSLRPGGLVRSAYACGSRTFVKSAAACIDVSLMPLNVGVVAGDSAYAGATWSGTFTVMSQVFGSGLLSLNFGDLHVQANVLPDGREESATVYETSNPQASSPAIVTLTRL